MASIGSKSIIDGLISSGWMHAGGLLCFKKIINKNTITLTLERVDGGLFIKHPHYGYQSKVSHFASRCDNTRLSLNKNILERVVMDLKKANVWQHISNKDFLVVNTMNLKSDKSKILSQLKDLIA